MNNVKLISISGPTASGKSGLAVALAKALEKEGQRAEIVSCDSMQIYRGMDVGTGKVKPEEQEGIPHRLLDLLDPSEECSLADFTALAHEAIEQVAKTGALPILCGGTGLYLDHILYNTTLSDVPADEALRAELEQYDNDTLHQRLAAADPESAVAIHKNNRKRVIRALEIYLVSGKTKSYYDSISKSKVSRYNAKRVHLVSNDRDFLYERINRRVDGMFLEGLEAEVRRVFSQNPSKTAAQAIGYKEFLPYFEGSCTLLEVKEQIKQASRNYAKRQLTWFKKEEAGALCLDCALKEEEKLALCLAFLKDDAHL
jgi:tRNA dimethylallyltransferase